MILEEIAIELAEDILKDFQVLLASDPELKRYMDSWRAKEIREIIEEIKSGKVKDHPMIDNFSTMVTDEITDFPLLQEKLTVLRHMVNVLSRNLPIRMQ